MKYNTVIFDMDGTLLNTIEDLTDSLNYIMEKNGLPTFSIDQVKHMVGSGSAVLIERALENGRENPDFDRILSEYSEYYEAHCNIKTGPYHHIPELLAELKKRGYKLAIVSNKPMAAVEELRKAYFSECVDVAIGVTDKLRRKPYPDECLAAMQQLGCEKADCIYVGDSEIDHRTAVNTGIKCISCLWGFRTLEELLEAGAADNFIVKDPLEILDIIC
jgi:phosphoglycolate phosphatase